MPTEWQFYDTIFLLWREEWKNENDAHENMEKIKKLKAEEGKQKKAELAK